MCFRHCCCGVFRVQERKLFGITKDVDLEQKHTLRHPLSPISMYGSWERTSPERLGKNIALLAYSSRKMTLLSLSR